MKYLQKVFSVIEIVAKGAIGGSTVAEVTDASGLPTSSVHRILNELVECDVLLKREGLHRYRMSPRIAPFIQEIARKMNLDTLRSVLVELRDQVNETVFLSELTERGVASVLTVESNRVFSFRAKAGVYLPVNCTAAGLAIAAHIEPVRAQQLFEHAQQNGDPLAKRCSTEEFLVRLEKVRKEGFAFCNEEYEPGLRALAVPVLNAKGMATASITAIAPGERFADPVVNVRIIEDLKTAARKTALYTG
ncbi:MAG TPA: IclR family transcriptional regulator [Thermotogota bacterium]|nr:IclR family transcriptional regulator [Thermotogota bacterium]HRW92880.1 IclR family transcriptional regulator [Thermotogota bacterium]